MSLGASFVYSYQRLTAWFHFLWLLLPIIGVFFFLGYCVEVIRSVLQGDDYDGPPEYSDKAEGIKDGLLLFIGFVFLIVLFLFLFLPGLLYFSLISDVSQTVFYSLYGFLSVFFLFGILLLPFLFARSSLFRDCINLFHAWNVLLHNLGSFLLTLVYLLILLVVYSAFGSLLGLGIWYGSLYLGTVFLYVGSSIVGVLLLIPLVFSCIHLFGRFYEEAM